MAHLTWRFDGDDGPHTVEIKHGYWRGERMVCVDGQVILDEPPKLRYAVGFDLGSKHPFKAGSAQCLLTIRMSSPSYKYELSVDGRHIEPFSGWTKPPIPEP